MALLLQILVLYIISNIVEKMEKSEYFNIFLDTEIPILLDMVKKEYGIYQNLDFPEMAGITCDRDCDIRWSKLKPEVSEGSSFLDLGSNMGYFCFQARFAGLFAMGIESHWANFALSQAFQRKYSIDNISFVLSKISRSTLSPIPNFDYVNCLSLFHHFVFSYGLGESLELMKLIAKKTNKKIFFETGQPNENTKYDWRVLGFMGSEPYKWIEQMLRNSGFKNVELVSEIDTHLSNVKRGLFVGEK